jgi:hypothetical protein
VLHPNGGVDALKPLPTLNSDAIAMPDPITVPDEAVSGDPNKIGQFVRFSLRALKRK